MEFVKKLFKATELYHDLFFLKSAKKAFEHFYKISISLTMTKTNELKQMESASVAGFFAFCRSNAPLVAAVTIALFFTYGIKLICYNFGVDTNWFMAQNKAFSIVQIAVGRFGIVLMWFLRWQEGFNPLTAFFTAFCLIWFFTLSWCYVIALFDKNTGRNNKLIPFALVFMTMPVWAEQFYFVFQATENALIIAMCPYVIHFLFKGFLEGRKGKVAGAVILFAFMISVYQAIIPLFLGGVCACFLLWRERSDCEPRVYRKLCLQLATSLAVSTIIYFFLARAVIPALFQIELLEYMDNMNHWGSKPLSEIALQLLLFCYLITVGHIQQAQEIVIQMMMNYSQPSQRRIEMLINAGRTAGNILLFPIVIVFLIKLNIIARENFLPKRRLLYVLAGVGIPLSIMVLAFLGGNIPPVRALYALPFATAFMFFFVARASKKRFAAIVTTAAILLSLYQAGLSARLFYSDHVRFSEDTRLAYELGGIIRQTMPEGKNLPVAFVGRYDGTQNFRNHTKGQVIGHSIFEHSDSRSWALHTTGLVLSTMSILGMHFDEPNPAQLVRAQAEAASMPAYPNHGYVRAMEDMIVIKISNRMYDRDVDTDPELQKLLLIGSPPNGTGAIFNPAHITGGCDTGCQGGDLHP